MSLSLVFMNSILMIGVYGLVVSLFVCYVIRLLFSSWFGAISVVVYVGGLLVIFSYFLAICPNQIIRINTLAPVGISLFFFGALFMASAVYFPSVGVSYGDVVLLYKGENGGFLVFLVVFLLLALIRVVKVVRLSQGPLRPFSS